VQATAHLEALSRVRRFDEVRVWSRTVEHARRFAAAHGARAMDAEAARAGRGRRGDPYQCPQPNSEGCLAKVRAHVNAVGSPRPTWRELDDEAMANTLVADSREAVLKESGDVILSGAQIQAEAGEMFAGTKSVPVADTTAFKSVGLAIEDLAAARVVHDTILAGRGGSQG
jgi:ornithine cyclodeaminase/alanine dehydrogenase-like protein (mu-crystallin family)